MPNIDDPAPIQVIIRDRGYERIGPVTQLLSLDLSIRRLGPGDCTFSVDADDRIMAEMSSPGARAAVAFVRPDGTRRTLFSGDIDGVNNTGLGSTSVRTFTVSDDWNRLNDLLGWVDPTKGIGSQGDEKAYWKTTGPLDVDLYRLIAANTRRLGVGLRVPSIPTDSTVTTNQVAVKMGYLNVAGPDSSTDTAAYDRMNAQAPRIASGEFGDFVGLCEASESDLLLTKIKQTNTDWALLKDTRQSNHAVYKPSLYTKIKEATVDYTGGRYGAHYTMRQRSTGFEFNVILAHAMYDKSGKSYASVRNGQYRALIAYAKNLPNCVIMGDFNNDDGTQTTYLHDVMRAAGYQGLQEKVGSSITNGNRNSYSGATRSFPAWWIDDIFVPTGLTVSSAAGVALGSASDHYLGMKATVVYVKSTTVTASTQPGGYVLMSRMHTMTERLLDALDAAGLGIRVIQGEDSGDHPLVQVYSGSTRPKVYEGSGAIEDIQWNRVAPTVTRLVLGLGGEDVARVFKLYPPEVAANPDVLTALEQRWRIREKFLSATDIDPADPDLNALVAQRGKEAMQDGGEKVSLSAKMVESDKFVFESGFDLADVLPFQLEGAPVLSDRVNEIGFAYGDDGLVITPLVGDWTEDEATAEIMRDVDRLAQKTSAIQKGI